MIVHVKQLSRRDILLNSLLGSARVKAASPAISQVESGGEVFKTFFANQLPNSQFDVRAGIWLTGGRESISEALMTLGSQFSFISSPGGGGFSSKNLHVTLIRESNLIFKNRTIVEIAPKAYSNTPSITVGEIVNVLGGWKEQETISAIAQIGV